MKRAILVTGAVLSLCARSANSVSVTFKTQRFLKVAERSHTGAYGGEVAKKRSIRCVQMSKAINVTRAAIALSSLLNLASLVSHPPK